MKTKTIKKLTAALSALFILAASTGSFAVSAAEYNPPYYIDINRTENIKELIDKIPGSKIVFEDYWSSVVGYTTFVIGVDSETDSPYINSYAEKRYIFTVETIPGKELPVDEINEKIAPYTLKEAEKTKDKNVYTISVGSLDARKNIFEVLSSYEQTALITEAVEIWTNTLCGIRHVEIKSPLSIEEVEEQYNFDYFDLNLRTSSYGEDDGKHIYLADWGKNTITNMSDPEYCEKLEKLLKNDDVFVEFWEAISIPDSESFSTIVYEKESHELLYGDINRDLCIDMSDLSLLSLYLIGDNEFNDIQKIAANINDDGQINLSDLAKLKRYISRNDDTIN